MTTEGDAGVSDAVLTAYLDDELEPAAREDVERLVRSDSRIRDRLAVLACGGRGVRPAFDRVLDAAPDDRLEALLARAAARSRSPPLAPVRHHVRRGLMAMAASLLLVIGGTAGFMVGQAPPAFLARMFAWDEWQESIARQVSLHDRASLAAIEVDPADQRVRLARLSAELGISLSPELVQLPGLSLKRVERLRVEDRPLLQLLYDGDETGPVALCIVREPDEGGERASRRIAGMNLVYWTADGYGFLLVGAAPADTIRGLAEIASSRFPT